VKKISKILYMETMSTMRNTLNGPQTRKTVSRGGPFTYQVLPVDVDGDGIPDGDLVMKINAKGETVSRRFISSSKMEQIVEDMKGSEDLRVVKRVNADSAAPDIRVMPEKQIASSQYSGGGATEQGCRS